MKPQLKFSLLPAAIVLSFLALFGSFVPPEAAKVTLCHKGKTLKVDEIMVSAHLAHGDALGACE